MASRESSAATSFVPGSIPGDELAVEIEVVKENFAMAEIVDEDELNYE